jgi:hypothetical protein
MTISSSWYRAIAAASEPNAETGMTCARTGETTVATTICIDQTTT